MLNGFMTKQKKDRNERYESDSIAAITPAPHGAGVQEGGNEYAGKMIPQISNNKANAINFYIKDNADAEREALVKAVNPQEAIRMFMRLYGITGKIKEKKFADGTADDKDYARFYGHDVTDRSPFCFQLN